MFGLNKQQFIIFLTLGSIIVALAFFALDEELSFNDKEESFDVDQAQSTTIITESHDEIEPEEIKENVIIEKEENLDVTIYVTGCVYKPGVYTLEAGSRLADAMALAGGATDEANLLAVNLALIVTDEGMYVIPKQGEEVNVVPQLTNGTTQNESSKININTATQNELEQLSGIGPVKAEAIICYRETNGCFKNVNEITLVTGIGAKTLEAIKNEISVN